MASVFCSQLRVTILECKTALIHPYSTLSVHSEEHYMSRYFSPFHKRGHHKNSPWRESNPSCLTALIVWGISGHVATKQNSVY